ncbi:MAG: lysophospholipid acyltransferase family protein [bacterium]|nr:lysophospholipid acyltransferase family protein [bacterium]
MNPYYKLTHFALIKIFKSLFNLKAIGNKNIPQKGSVLILSNHASNLDPFLVGTSLFREVHFLAKAELFKPMLLNKTLSSLNAFPIKRGAVDRKAFSKCLQILKEKKVLLLFPEGTRSRNGELQEGHAGAGMIIAKAITNFHTIIIPAYIRDSYKSLPKGKLIPNLNPIQVIFGIPIEYSEEILNNPNKENYQKVVNIAMKKINSLKRLHNGNNLS